jgi:hypothetical protein
MIRKRNVLICDKCHSNVAYLVEDYVEGLVDLDKP